MLPTMEFCFKELMKNSKVRKGFVAAILGKAPETVRQTTLLNTELRKGSEDDKLGILDVLVELDGCRRAVIMINCKNVSMSASSILSIFLRIISATGRLPSVMWKPVSSIRT